MTGHRAAAMSEKPPDDHATRIGLDPAPPLEQQDLGAWATELAANLPPLTERQATAVGRIATQVDRRLNDELAA
jgi:hypothetical protein